MWLLGRFQTVRNARIVAAYEERMAMMQADATENRLLSVGLPGVIRASMAAKQMRLKVRQQMEKSTVKQASESQYFRRQKVAVGLSYTTTLLLLLVIIIMIIIIIIVT